jgi:diacylglycerol kinase family enzyme
VDVGLVGERIFLNNSGLGLYPTIVHHREMQQQRLGRSKWVAFTWALLQAFNRLPFMKVHIATDSEDLVKQTPIVFIGNNEYEVTGFDIGSRNRLDGGRLSIYVLHKIGRLSMIWLAIRALLGLLHEGDGFDRFDTREILIETAQAQLRVSIDGEVVEMSSPLRYTISPQALRVIVPAPSNQSTNE